MGQNIYHFCWDLLHNLRVEAHIRYFLLMLQYAVEENTHKLKSWNLIITLNTHALTYVYIYMPRSKEDSPLFKKKDRLFGWVNEQIFP